MVAGGEHSATVLAEPHDGVGIGGGETVTDVDGHQPQLVVVEFVDVTQYRVVVAPVVPVARGHLVAGDA